MIFGKMNLCLGVLTVVGLLLWSSCAKEDGFSAPLSPTENTDKQKAKWLIQAGDMVLHFTPMPSISASDAIVKAGIIDPLDEPTTRIQVLNRNEPIAHVKSVLTNIQNQRIFNATTDVVGQGDFGTIDEGTYQLQVSLNQEQLRVQSLSQTENTIVVTIY